jgi:hypothetical protein
VRHLNILLLRLFCDSSNVQQTTLQIKFTYSVVPRVAGLLRFIPPKQAAQYYQRKSSATIEWQRFQLVSRILLEASRFLIKIIIFHYLHFLILLRCANRFNNNDTNRAQRESAQATISVVLKKCSLSVLLLLSILCSGLFSA